jgi:hypothetical protein
MGVNLEILASFMETADFLATGIVYNFKNHSINIYYFLETPNDKKAASVEAA